MCDKCKSTGSWDLLEKFLSVQKSDEKLDELNMLKSRCRMKENFQQIWKDVTNDCQSIKYLSAEEYKTALDNFSFPVIK